MTDAADTTQPCPVCQRAIGVHTVDELAEHLSSVHDHDLPFEEFPEREQEIQMVRAGSISVKAGAQKTAIGTFPVLIFEFSGPDGVLPPIGLLLDDRRMRDVRQLIGQSIDAALKHARRAR